MKSILSINEYSVSQWKLPNGQLHREDGPAIEYLDGNKYWFLNGVEYNEKEYKYEIRSRKLKQLL